MIKKNTSTPAGKSIWDIVDRAAENAPEWTKPHIKEAVRRQIEYIKEQKK